jgi:hypothetical protein
MYRTLKYATLHRHYVWVQWRWICPLIQAMVGIRPNQPSAMLGLSKMFQASMDVTEVSSFFTSYATILCLILFASPFVFGRLKPKSREFYVPFGMIQKPWWRRRPILTIIRPRCLRNSIIIFPCGLFLVKQNLLVGCLLRHSNRSGTSIGQLPIHIILTLQKYQAIIATNSTWPSKRKHDM